jgi:hypothetical protein
MKIDIILGMGFSYLFGRKRTQFTTGAEDITVDQVIAEFLESNIEFKNRLKTQKILYSDKLKAVYVVDSQVVKPDFIIKNDVTLKILPAISGG